MVFVHTPGAPEELQKAARVYAHVLFLETGNAVDRGEAETNEQWYRLAREGKCCHAKVIVGVSFILAETKKLLEETCQHCAPGELCFHCGKCPPAAPHSQSPGRYFCAKCTALLGGLPTPKLCAERGCNAQYTTYYRVCPEHLPDVREDAKRVQNDRCCLCGGHGKVTVAICRARFIFLVKKVWDAAQRETAPAEAVPAETVPAASEIACADASCRAPPRGGSVFWTCVRHLEGPPAADAACSVVRCSLCGEFTKCALVCHDAFVRLSRRAGACDTSTRPVEQRSLNNRMLHAAKLIRELRAEVDTPEKAFTAALASGPGFYSSYATVLGWPESD